LRIVEIFAPLHFCNRKILSKYRNVTEWCHWGWRKSFVVGSIAWNVFDLKRNRRDHRRQALRFGNRLRSPRETWLPRSLFCAESASKWAI